MLSIDYHSVKCRFHLVIAMQLKVSSFLLFSTTSGITTPVLTSEYMSFSLPLSDVITMYTNSTSDKQNNLNNDQTHLQLSLQINPIQRDGGESVYSSNFVMKMIY
jgi:hypothetical protein